MNIFSKWRSFNFKVATVLFIISTYLVLTWLPNSQIIGGGDVGIPTLFPQKQLEEVTSAWWESHATGVTSAITYTAVPFYYILSIFEKIGVGADIIQKGLFVLILFGGSVSIYFLALIFNFSKWTSFFAALFYIFNLTALSVWQRGVHNAMLMFLLAPLSLFILVKGINTQKYASIIWINIVSFLLSYTFGALGYVFSLWLLWTIYLLVIIWDKWRDKTTRKFLLTYYFILVVAWVGTNFWWILHFLLLGNYTLGQYTPQEFKTMGSDVLVGLKPYHQPQYILRGLSAFYHYGIKDWGDSYINPLLILLSWIPTLIIFSTTFIKKNYKQTFWKYLIILTVVILALSKGVNPPLGLLNVLPYDLFPFLAPLRNPYEKIGILLAIPFSLLFAQGLYQTVNFLKFRKMHYLSLLSSLIGIVCLTVLVWPLWLGKLFVSEGRKYTVSIPSYYKEANSWLKEKVLAEDTRILHLPLSWGESVDYNWDYTGIEPSQYFFNGSSVGYEIGVTPVDSRIRDLLLSIHNQDTVIIQKAIASLNIGWFVIHNETLYRNRILESPERINKWLATQPYFLEHTIDFGPLSIWRVKDQYRLGHIFTANKLINTTGIRPQASLNIWDKIIILNDSFLTEMQDNYRSMLSKYLSENIALSAKSLIYRPLETINEEISFKQLAQINVLPGSLIYPLAILKENISVFLNQDDRVVNCFVLSGKRLKEAALSSRQNKFQNAIDGLENYKKQLEKCSGISRETVIGYMSSQFRSSTLGQLIMQKEVLEKEFNHAQIIKEGQVAKLQLSRYLAEVDLVPLFEPIKLANNKQRIIFSFHILEEGRYSIKIDKPSAELIKVSPKIVQIDNQSVEMTPAEVNEISIKYPSSQLSEGSHEVQMETDISKNLLESQIQYKKTNPNGKFRTEIDPVTQEAVFVEKAISAISDLTFDLSNIKVGQNYELFFDVLLTQGVPPFITITHDSDPVNALGNQIPAVKTQVGNLFKSTTLDWQTITMAYLPVLNSTSAKLSFITVPQDIVNPTEVKIKNISFKEVNNYNLVLENESQKPIHQIFKTDIVWKKINSTLYELTLSNQKSPFILVFSETFHPLWKIIDSTGTTLELPHFSINGFANAWLVKESLPKRVYIKFILQDARNTGIVISLISLLLLIGFVIILDYRRKQDV